VVVLYLTSIRTRGERKKKKKRDASIRSRVFQGPCQPGKDAVWGEREGKVGACTLIVWTSASNKEKEKKKWRCTGYQPREQKNKDNPWGGKEGKASKGQIFTSLLRRGKEEGGKKKKKTNQPSFRVFLISATRSLSTTTKAEPLIRRGKIAVQEFLDR